MGWRGGKRRVVAVVGAAGFVLGFLFPLALGALLWDTTWSAATTVAMAAAALLVVGGFVAMWEALVTWPDDGSPYPLRRRAKAATAVLVIFAAYLLVLMGLGRTFQAILPRTWWGDLVTQLVAFGAAFSVMQRLWRWLRARHWLQGPIPSSSD